MAITTLWHTFPLLFLCLLAPSFASLSTSFENTAIVRTVELGGAIVHVTTTYAIKAIEAGSKIYTIALGAEEMQKTSWIEAKIKGQQSTLTVSEHGFSPNKYV
jgi:oligosaccharyltransferase complex subunit alpha (ribophorin I)